MSKTFKEFNEDYFRKKFCQVASKSKLPEKREPSNGSRQGSRQGSRRGSRTHLFGPENEDVCAAPEVIPGRVVVDASRILAHELHLMTYSIDTTAKEVLGIDFPNYSPNLVSDWWQASKSDSYYMFDVIRTTMKIYD